MLKSRTYNRLVKLYSAVSSNDEYGEQNIATPVFRQSVMASVRNLSASRTMVQYQSADVEAYEILVRYVPYRISHVEFNGLMIGIDSIEDVRMRGRELRLTGSCKRQ